MHGAGGGAPQGNQNAWKHGGYSGEALHCAEKLRIGAGSSTAGRDRRVTAHFSLEGKRRSRAKRSRTSRTGFRDL